MHHRAIQQFYKPFIRYIWCFFQVVKNYDSGRSKSAECDVDMFLFTTMSLLFINLGLCSLLLVIGASLVFFLVRELLAAMPNHNIDSVSTSSSIRFQSALSACTFLIQSGHLLPNVNNSEFKNHGVVVGVGVPSHNSIH